MTFDVLDPASYELSGYAVPTFLAGAATLLLGIGVIIRARGSLIGVSFFLLTGASCAGLLAFSFMYCAVSEAVALKWARIAYIAIPFIPPSIYQFTVAALKIYDRQKKAVALTWVLSAGFTFAVLRSDALIRDLDRYWWGYYPQYGWLSIPYLVFYFTVMTASLYHYVVEYGKAISLFDRVRIKWLVAATSVAYLGSFDYLAKYGFPVYPFGYVPFLVFVVMVAHAVWNSRTPQLSPAFAAARIVSTMHDVLAVCDAQGLIRVVNGAAERILGYEESELISKPADAIFGLIPVDEQRDKEIKVKAKDGRPVDLSVSISRLEDRKGRLAGAVIVARDISERIRVERMKEQFLSTVSHEIRTPLTILKEAVVTLKAALSGQIADEQGRILEIADRNADRLARIIGNILDLSRLESRRAVLNLDMVWADRLIKETVKNFELVARKKSVAIEMDCPENMQFMADPDMISRVMDNLVENALRYAHRTVNIKAFSANGPAAANGGVEFVVSDDGPGVRFQDRAFLFTKFSQIHRPKSGRGYKGTGLGLAICREIVALHGGRIWIESEPGHGAQFHFFIPKQ